LDLQNILVDKAGNVTGIIDWDGAFAAPRCLGPAAVPKFLQRDWFPDDDNRIFDESPYMAWNVEYYRKIYAAALMQAEKSSTHAKSDMSKYTLKSPIYQAALSALYEGGDPWDFTDRILRELPGIRNDPLYFKVKLGVGWPAAEAMLRREIHKLCEPALPDEKFLLELDVEVEIE
ncbi:hypothetical protein CC80DRAFT_367372, partial [Byssothecium circinans]